MALVFEAMGQHLLSLIKASEYRGISLRLCKSIARQILAGLSFLHDSCQARTPIHAANARAD